MVTLHKQALVSFQVELVSYILLLITKQLKVHYNNYAEYVVEYNAHILLLTCNNSVHQHSSSPVSGGFEWRCYSPHSTGCLTHHCCLHHTSSQEQKEKSNQ